MNIVIRENIEDYMKCLKEWVESIKEDEFEEMDSFFTNRINLYEDHMKKHWEDSYKTMANKIPYNTKNLLDIGCGTGLELDSIFEKIPDIEVTGIDLCKTMLNKLYEKHGNRNISLLCGDYFKISLPKNEYDIAISVQSLHHFKSENKLTLFKKIYNALKDNGEYIQCDYIACCAEEEVILAKKCDAIRRKANLSGDVLIHFDTPLTLENEINLLKSAGFTTVEVLCCINGSTMIKCKK